MAFEAARFGQSIHITEILWLHLFDVGFQSRPDFAARRFGLFEDYDQPVWEFAVDARSRMRQKSLVLEFFDLLGAEQARVVVETVQQSRLEDRTPAGADVDPTVFHLIDSRDPQEFVRSMCATLDD